MAAGWQEILCPTLSSMFSKIKNHLRTTICNSLYMETSEKMKFSDETNRIEIREIICDFEEKIVTFKRRNRYNCANTKYYKALFKKRN